MLALRRRIRKSVLVKVPKIVSMHQMYSDDELSFSIYRMGFFSNKIVSFIVCKYRKQNTNIARIFNSRSLVKVQKNSLRSSTVNLIGVELEHSSLSSQVLLDIS